MDKHIVNKCSDCFHYKACKAMLVNFGLADYMPESSDADRCPDFVPTADVAIVRNGVWIPVSERLPDNADFVLVVVSGQYGNITLDNAIELGQFSMSEGWILEMWPESEDPKVTHWMPLPVPPKDR